MNKYLLCVVAVAATCGLLFGFDTSIIAGATPFIQQEFAATPFEIELIVSACVLGALFGALSVGKCIDYLGRKKVLLTTGIIFVVGTLGATLSHSVTELIISRFIFGFAIGIGSLATPMFIAEIAPAKYRGNLVLWNGAFLTGGQVIAFLVDYLFTSSGAWRFMILSGIIPAVILTLGMCSIPESPRWLLAHGKTSLAQNILQKIRGNVEIAKAEIEMINSTLKLPQIPFKNIFKQPLWSVMLIGFLLGIGQQFMGINTVMYYGPHIMRSIGFSGALTQMAGTLGLGLTNFIFTVIILLFIDKIGRRKFLLLGSMLAAISLLLMVFLLSSTITQFTAILSLICLIVYMIGYCISLGSLFWLMIAEIFPLSAKGKCMSIVVALQWGANFIVTASFLTILNQLGVANTFLLYANVSVIVFAFIYFKVPETKDVELETIERNLNLMTPTRWLGKPQGDNK